MMASMNLCKSLLLALWLSVATSAFAPSVQTSTKTSTQLYTSEASRRNFLETLATSSAAAAASLTFGSLPAFAADAADGVADTSLEGYLYKVIRVREATQQERRLITSGKFKDIQRANVKLAVKFMVQNFRLSDSVVGASAYLNGSNQMNAIEVGQSAVQSLQTILEYFDTSDVENIKVSG